MPIVLRLREHRSILTFCECALSSHTARNVAVSLNDSECKKTGLDKVKAQVELEYCHLLFFCQINRSF